MCICAWGQQRAPARPQGSLIAGSVVDQNTGAVVSDATVRLTLISGENPYAIDISDENGHFGFSYLPPGRYRLLAFKEGYESGVYGARKPGEPGAVLVLGPSDQRWNVTLRVARQGVISGTVFDTDGDPMARAEVLALRNVWRRGKRQWRPAGQGTSDDRGQYRIAGLLPDQYIVEARPMPMVRTFFAVGSLGSAPAAQQRALAPVFYPNAGSTKDAGPVEVEAGKETGGIDIRLVEEQEAVVQASVSAPEGFPARVPIQIWAEPPEGGMRLASWMTVIVQPGGSGVLKLPPGSYRLIASATAGEKHYRGITNVDVTSGAEIEAAIPLSAGVDVSGSVKLAGGAKAPGAFEVTLSPGDGVFIGNNPKTTTRADSSFVFTGVLPGTWDIGVKPIPEDGYVESMRLGKQDVLTGDMVIGTSAPAPLNIVIGTRGAKVEGDVDLGGRRGPVSAAVLLAPVGKFDRVLSFYRVSRADETGHFLIRGIRPGTYRLYAFEGLPRGGYRNPEFLKPFESEGQTIPLSEGQSLKANPRLLEVETAP